MPMPKLRMRSFLVLAILSAVTTTVFACPPTTYTRDDLFQLKAIGFEKVSAEKANALSVELLVCLGDPDPKIRDGIVFEAIQLWLRTNQLSTETIQTIHTRLLQDLTGPEDPGGYLRPFAALLLSEVARVDRLHPFMTPAQRTALANAAADFMTHITDYRGFDEVEGWRHRVAHTADLILQLSLNNQVGKPELKTMMQAVFSQVAPKGPVFYTYGEPARLALPVYFAHRRSLLTQGLLTRDLLTKDEWAELFRTIADPKPFATWRDVYTTQTGLARRHNTIAFLNEVYTTAKTANDPQAEELAVFAQKDLEALEK